MHAKNDCHTHIPGVLPQSNMERKKAVQTLLYFRIGMQELRCFLGDDTPELVHERKTCCQELCRELLEPRYCRNLRLYCFLHPAYCTLLLMFLDVSNPEPGLKWKAALRSLFHLFKWQGPCPTSTAQQSGSGPAADLGSDKF